MTDVPNTLPELNPFFDALRKEGKTFDPGPLPSQCLVPDYSESTLRIGTGLTVLDESIPNGQKERTEAAYRVLRRGVAELGVWLNQKGISVD